MKKITFEIPDIESGASRVAAQVLLIGLKHIAKHRMSHPIDTTEEEWFDEIVPELIWFCEFMVEDGITNTPEKRRRYYNGRNLLGKYFTDIWC